MLLFYNKLETKIYLIFVYFSIGNFTLESQLMQNKYIERMSEQVTSIQETLIMADTSYWRCDPKHQVEGETYTQITRLVQVSTMEFMNIFDFLYLAFAICVYTYLCVHTITL